MSWDYNQPKAASNNPSKSGKGVIYMNVGIIKYSNIVDQFFEYSNIFVDENFYICI